MLRNKLEKILQSNSGEHSISTFLASYPEIVRWAFCKTGGHQTYVLKEFPFGSRYRADFVVPFSSSGGWDIHMIELKSPDDKVINKDGTPSRRFNKALAEVYDWNAFIEQNPYSVRRDLSDWCIKRDLLGIYGKYGPPSNYTGNYLHDPTTYIDYHYHIVIGRRDFIDDAKRIKMNQYSRGMHIEIRTYGRFLDCAAEIDRHHSYERETRFGSGRPAMHPQRSTRSIPRRRG
jgi:hypothetical protein